MPRVRLTKDQRHVLTVLSKHPELDEAGARNETGHTNAPNTGDELVAKGLATKSRKWGRTVYRITDLGREIVGG